MRLSSTTLAAYLTCPRKFRYEMTTHPVQPTEAMAWGTLFHAFVEFYQNRRRLPSSVEFARLGGNYDTPEETRARFPAAYEPAREAAKFVIEQHPECFELPADAETEVSLERFGLEIAGVPVRGFLDVLVPSQRRIIDWKTRKSLKYAPRTQDDFRANPQLVYYAAAVAGALGWSSVTVEHWNVQRHPFVFEPIAVELPAYYLRGVWQYLETDIVPAMLRALQGDENEVERELSACYKYGPCPHLKYCEPTPAEEAVDPLNLLLGAL